MYNSLYYGKFILKFMLKLVKIRRKMKAETLKNAHVCRIFLPIYSSSLQKTFIISTIKLGTQR